MHSLSFIFDGNSFAITFWSDVTRWAGLFLWGVTLPVDCTKYNFVWLHFSNSSAVIAGRFEISSRTDALGSYFRKAGTILDRNWHAGLLATPNMQRLTPSTFQQTAAPDYSFQPAVGQIVLVQTEVMTEFVQERSVDFLAEKFFVCFGLVPNVFEKQNDLRGHRDVAFVGKLRPHK